MEKMKQIMYGVTDFARMRAENGYFVDRTGLIRELEKTRYLARLWNLKEKGGAVALCEAI